MDADSSWWPGRRALLFALGGLGSVAIWFGVSSPGDERGPGAECIWVADRDGDRLVRLDRNLFVMESIEVPAPVAVALEPSSGWLWVQSADRGDRRARHRLLAISEGEGRAGQAMLEVVPGAVFLTGDSGGLWVVEPRGETLAALHRLAGGVVAWSLDLEARDAGRPLAGAPFEAFVPDGRGGGLLVAAGHVVRIDRFGQALAGQGGFVFARAAAMGRRGPG